MLATRVVGEVETGSDHALFSVVWVVTRAVWEVDTGNTNGAAHSALLATRVVRERYM